MAVRGQATTEAALGILAISTVIVFGIHFAEISILSLKVHEAVASAVWDTTSKKMHDLSGGTANMGPRQSAVGAAGPDTTTRYRDFDGRSSRAGNAPSLVFTQAFPIGVTCREDLGSLPAVQVPAQLAGVFGTGAQGGMACQADADVSLAPNFTRRFLQNRPFRQQHVQVNNYHVCSMGRANGNSCGAELLVALGDWGLTDGSEANNCDVTPPGAPCANAGYYGMAQTAYLANGGSLQSGLNLSQWLYEGAFGGPAAQVLENAFFMAALGEDAALPFQKDNPFGEHNGWGPYTVTPGGPYDNNVLQNYPQAYQQREACAFGLPCDPAQWPSYQ